jgi:thiol-disulfide isomerase/thioredoxin
MLVIAVSVAILAGAASVAIAGTGGTTNQVKPDAFVLPRLDGSGTVSLVSLRGRPVVANFFASWCPQCRTELPAFTQAARSLEGRVAFLEVNSLETGNGAAMAKQFGLAQSGALVLRDVGGGNNSGLHDALGGGNGMPITAFYGETGRLLTVHLGAFPSGGLSQELADLYGIRPS